MFRELCKTDVNLHAPPTSLEKALLHMQKVIPTGSLVYIVSDFYEFSATEEKQIRKLRKRCDLMLISIDDPADKYIPSMGTLSFSDKGLGKILISDQDQEGRAAYTQYWNNTRKSLRKLASQLAIPLLSLKTCDDVSSVLFLRLKYIQKRR